MDALFVTVAFSVSVTPMATVLPAGTLPSEQVTGTVAVQEPWLGTAESNVAAVDENPSLTITCGTAVLPELITRISYPAVELAGAEVGPLIVTATSTGAGGGGGGGGGTGALGVMALEGAEFALAPTELIAVTTKVYVVPFLSPVNVAIVPGAATCTVNPVGVPPVSAETV